MWKMPQSYSCNCKCSSALGRILRFGPKQKQKKHKKKENKAARTWPALKAPGPAYITIPNFGQKPVWIRKKQTQQKFIYSQRELRSTGFQCGDFYL